MKLISSFFKILKVRNPILAKPNADIYVGASPIHGRGVFARKAISAGAVIEKCPVIKMKLEEVAVRKHLMLNYYTFMLDEEAGYAGVALGYGSLYNHSEHFNATYFYEKDTELVIFEARQPIARDREITINYLGSSDSDKRIENWFDKPEL